MKPLIAAIALCLFTAAAAPSDALDRFAGTWRSQGTILTTPYSAAATASGTTTCAWSGDRIFMICQQVAMLNDRPDHDIAIYSYDSTAGAYRFCNVRTGKVTSFEITVQGDTITYPFSFTDAGKTIQIRTLNVWKSATLYTWRTEYSTDGQKTWTLMGSGTSQRVRSPVTEFVSP